MRPKALKQASLAQKKLQLLNTFSPLMQSLLPKDNCFKNIFDFSTAGERDCVVTVGRLPALHFSVDCIFLYF